MMRLFFGFVLFGQVASSVCGGADCAGSVSGTWIFPQDKTLIRIEESETGLKGWIAERPHGRTDEVDHFNPEKNLQDRHIVGLQVLWDVKKSEPGKWTSGYVYDPDSGHNYRARVNCDGKEGLVFRGYFLIPLFGRSVTLKRQKPDHPSPSVASPESKKTAVEPENLFK